ncbi:MAG: type 2 lanthipeptide synthetase LanM family protein [Bacillota bacterium]
MNTPDYKKLRKSAYLNERYLNKPDISFENESDFSLTWKAAGEFDLKKLKVRAEIDGLTVDEFNQILENKDNFILKKDLKWMHSLNNIMNCKYKRSSIYRQVIEGKLFSTFFTPFLKYAEMCLIQSVDRFKGENTHTDYIQLPEIIIRYLENLHRIIYNLSIKTLIQELHIAKISNELIGNNSRERYAFFEVEILSTKKYLFEMFEVYPVLARLIVEKVMKYIDYNVEILLNFLNDIENIETLFVGNFTQLIEVEVGVGDSHNNGRSVAILKFKSDDRLVYKPRSLLIDMKFDDFLNWVNDKGFNCKLNSARVLPKENYGWQEYIYHHDCNSELELENFYYRYGGYIALLRLFNSRDFHLENIIANGENPILVDLETLFSNQLDFLRETNGLMNHFNKEFDSSIFSSLLVPSNINGNNISDVSALGQNVAVESTASVWSVKDAYTDKIRLVKKNVTLKKSNNQPTLLKKEINISNYFKFIEYGFKSMFFLLYDNSEELISPAGPIASFSDVKVRQVFRSTSDYGAFLESSLHPDYLQNGLNRVQLFDYLWKEVSQHKNLKEIVSSECSELVNHDVPMFTFNFNGQEVYNSLGHKLNVSFREDSLKKVMNNCRNLSEVDYEKQLRYLKLAFKIADKNYEGDSNQEVITCYNKAKQLTSNDFIEYASFIGEYLVKHAVWDKKNKLVTWLDLKENDRSEKYISPLGETLYDGSLGIILFLAYLAQESNNFLYKELAQDALNSTLSVIRDNEYQSLSAFNGLAAVSYVLVHLSELWSDENLYYEALKYIYEVEPLIERDEAFDIVGGVAGVIIIILNLYKLTPNERLINIAEKCGDHLSNYLIKKMADQFTEERLLTGLSHGVAGYAWALLKLHSVIHKKIYFDTAQGILKIERELYNEENNNWIDLRDRDNPHYNSVYWCHGAPGIGLGRSLISDSYEDDYLLMEIKLSIKKMVSNGFDFGNCLCHGGIGNLDILSVIKKKCKLISHDYNFLLFGQEIVQAMKEFWLTGQLNGNTSLGLMNGITGIGYGFLRIFNEELPSVLALELPHTKN